jgi:hypothetical protein
MNIFYLSEYADEAAEMHCDRHASKMVLETAQMLSAAHRYLDGDDYADRYGLYRMGKGHMNHPSTRWVRSSVDHYNWTLSLFWYQAAEKLKRFGTPHKSAVLLMDALAVVPDNIPDEGFEPPPQCMPEQYQINPKEASTDDTVRAYRAYYHGEKDFAVWKYTDQPTWWKGYRYYE